VSTNIVMPKLSDTMEEGTILKWLKKVGDQVTRGEVLAEVETDKADMELEAAESGVLREIKIGEGESAAVGAVIALVEEGDAASAPQKTRRRIGDRRRSLPRHRSPPRRRRVLVRCQARSPRIWKRRTHVARLAPRTRTSKRRRRPARSRASVASTSRRSAEVAARVAS
jgi:pyruvate/2-oxoglutarate dehydrogenase complex dihydrolipoamide acyltransferase (E2) component